MGKVFSKVFGILSFKKKIVVIFIFGVYIFKILR